jgi:hypothetical protein
VTRPVVSAVAERIYTALAPFTEQDEAYGWPLLTFVHVLTSAAAGVEALAADSDDAAGWSALLDPDTCPPGGLPFLGQMVGVQVPPGATATTARALVKAHGGWGRGTPAAIIGAAQLTLTGGKHVTLTERDGSPYRVKVTTYTAETPDTAALEAAVDAALPAGLVATFDLLTGWTVDEMETHYSGYTIDAMEADVAGETLDDFERTLP